MSSSSRRSFDFDLVIAGNGAIGCALALHFTEANPAHSVAIVGPARRPTSASAAAGAMLNVFSEIEPAQHAQLAGRTKFAIARAASASWAPHLAMLEKRAAAGNAPSIALGTYLLDREGASSRFDAIVRCLREVNEPFTEVDRGVDGVAWSPSTRALYLPNEGSIDARELLRAYDAAFAASPNIEVIDDEVASISPNEVVLRSSKRVLHATNIVIAAGVKSQELIDALGLSAKIPRLVTGAGTAIVVEHAAPNVTHVVRCVEGGTFGGLYLLPAGASRTYIGATTHIDLHGSSEPPTDDVDRLREAAASLIHTSYRDASVKEILFGWRPITLDTYPLIGRTSIDGVWIASGTRRDGLHLSPKIAEEIVRCMGTASDAQPFDGVFRPERPLLLEGGIPPELAAIHARLLDARPG